MSTMNPRDELVAAGIRLLEQEGPDGLQARRLAAEIGTSTMAVYTHFGGMGGLLEAIIREGFVRLRREEAESKRREDPITDIMAIGLAYRKFALSNPHLYKLMFGVSGPTMGHDLTVEGTPTVLQEANASFEELIEAVRRAMGAGRIREDDPVIVGGQIWSMIHGYVLLEISGVFGQDGHAAFEILGPFGVNLIVGLGDERSAAEACSIAAAGQFFTLPPPPVAQERFDERRRLRGT